MNGPIQWEENMTERRRFLTYAAGLSAAFGGMRAVSGNDDVSRDTTFSLSDRARNLLTAFRIQYPILQAPVGYSSGPDLVIAVSKAGCLGSMALTRASPEEAKERVKKVLAATNNPFVVNYILAVEAKSLPAALEAGAPIIQFSWGIPDREITSLVRKAGARFGVQVGSANGAKRAFDAGAEYVVCQGVEAGGHVQGTMPLMEALPAVLAIAGDKPVFAAGGIANGRGIRKVLDAGASGAMLGTRFVATQESYAHPDYKEALVRADSDQTVLTVCFDGGWTNATHRCVRNSTFINWEAAGCPPSGKRPGEGDVLGKRPDGTPFLRYTGASPSKAIVGDRIPECAIFAGLGVGQVKDLPTVEVLIKRLWQECQAATV